MLQLIRNSIDSPLMDTYNISNIIYDYLDFPSALSISTNFLPIHDLDKHEFLELTSSRKDLFNEYLIELKRMIGNKSFKDDSIIINKISNGRTTKEFIFAVYDNKLYPVYSISSIRFHYSINFFIKYMNELNGYWFVSYKYREQFYKNMKISGTFDDYKLYTTIWDSTYEWNGEKTLIKITIELFLDAKILQYAVIGQPFYTDKLDLDREYPYVFNLKTTLRREINNKYNHEKDIILCSIGYNNEELHEMQNFIK